MAKNEIKQILAERLNDLMERKRDIDYKLSDKKQAQQMDIPYNTFNNYRYATSECPISALVKMAKYFHVSTDYLLGLQGEPTDDPVVITVTEYITLSKEAVEKLHKISMRNKVTANSDTLSVLIEDVDFEYFLALLEAKMCTDNNLTKTVDVGNARIEIKTSDLNDYGIEKNISEISSRMKDKFLKKYKTVDERQEYLFRQKMYGFAEGLLRKNRITEQEYNQIIAEYDKGNFEYWLGRKV